jgi:hypothetical protein
MASRSPEALYAPNFKYQIRVGDFKSASDRFPDPHPLQPRNNFLGKIG